MVKSAGTSLLLPTSVDGMPGECIINCDQIQTLPRHKLGDRITELSVEKLEEVEHALLYALGFRPHK